METEFQRVETKLPREMYESFKAIAAHSRHSVGKELLILVEKCCVEHGFMSAPVLKPPTPIVTPQAPSAAPYKYPEQRAPYSTLKEEPLIQ